MRNGLTWQRLRYLGIGAWSVLGGALLLAAVVWLMVQVKVVLLPLALAVGIVYVLNPAVTRLQRGGVHRLVGATLCYLVMAGLLTLAAVLLAPVLREQGEQFAQALPSLVTDVLVWLQGISESLGINLGLVTSLEALQEWVSDPANQEVIREFLGGAGGVVAAVFRGVFEFVVVAVVGVVLAFYVLIDLPAQQVRARQLLPEGFRPEGVFLGHQLSTAVGGFVRGQLLVALVVGVLSSIGLAIIGLPFWLLIGMTAGVLNIIPFVGPWVGGVLAVLMALLTGDVGDAVLAALVMLGVQQLDNHIITPSVMRATVKLHPGLMVLALLIGGAQGGLVGVLLAIPVAATLKILVGHFWRTRVLGETWDEVAEAQLQEYQPVHPERLLSRFRGVRRIRVRGGGLQQTLPLDGYDEATTEELPTVGADR